MSTHADLRFKELAGIQQPSPGYGAMGLSHVYGPANDEESKVVLRRAIELRMTFWDTADVYGSGHNESLIGSVLAEGDNRAKVFLATKFGFDLNPANGIPFSTIRGDAAFIRKALEESIARLGTTPDLYYQHRVDPSVSLEETYSTLEELRKEGKFKYIRISEPSEETLRKAAKSPRFLRCKLSTRVGNPDRAQEFTPLTHRVCLDGVLKAARELGILVVACSPLGRGFLTGNIRSVDDLAPDDWRRHLPKLAQEHFENNFKIVVKLEAIAAKKGITPAQLALAWVSAQGPNIIPIPGTRTIPRLEENWASRKVEFTEQELSEIQEVIGDYVESGDRYPELGMKTVEI